jgi:GH15 family glucan-1,4-alpha-glucosidase
LRIIREPVRIAAVAAAAGFLLQAALALGTQLGSASWGGAYDGVSRKQFYCQDTNVLATRFFTPDGVGHVMDYMPVATQASGPERARQLIRHVKVTRGTMTFRLECSPAFDYARQEHETKITTEGARFCSPRLRGSASRRVAYIAIS